MKNALTSLERYEAAVGKRAAENTAHKHALQALMCALVKAHAPYPYLSAVSAILNRVEADEQEFEFLGGDLWLSRTDVLLKTLSA